MSSLESLRQSIRDVFPAVVSLVSERIYLEGFGFGIRLSFERDLSEFMHPRDTHDTDDTRLQVSQIGGSGAAAAST